MAETEFIRARSSQQKEQRMAEIKGAADALFKDHSYHEITLTTIAERLGWSRANLYKYVTTKEEIFLELCADKRESYFTSFQAAFPSGCHYSIEVFAQVWAELLYSHSDYLYYSEFLLTIIETNVSVERLAVFKKNYYESSGIIISLLSENLSLPKDKAESLFYAVYYHALGNNGGCFRNPLIQEALNLIGRPFSQGDFRLEMQNFIRMCLTYYTDRTN